MARKTTHRFTPLTLVVVKLKGSHADVVLSSEDGASGVTGGAGEVGRGT